MEAIPNIIISLQQDLDKKLAEIKTEEIFTKYSELKISTTIPIPTPEPIVTMGDAAICTPGNLTVLSGQSKSGKTALTSVILAGAIRTTIYDGFTGLEVKENKECKAVLHFDTEQSKHHHYRNLKYGILNRVSKKVEPEYYQSYNIRELNIKEYQNVCNELFEACNIKFGGIHLAVIDGAADFIKSVNDEEDSNRIVHYFEQLAVRYNCPIILIIHFNPGSEKQRGHLGSQLQRKAESVLAIKKEGDISYIEPQFLRNAGTPDVPKIQFSFDKNKEYHTYCGCYIKKEKQSKEEELRILAKQLFSLRIPLKYTAAAKQLMEIINQSERTAKSKIAEMISFKLINKNVEGEYELNEESEELVQ